MAFPKFQTKEVLNKVLNSGEDALNVDLSDSVTVTVDSEFPAAAAITDNFANPTTTSAMSMLMGWDTSTWDRVQIGDGTAASALRVTISTNDSHFGAVGAASDVDGVIHGQLRYIGAGVDTLETTLSNIETAVQIIDDWDDSNYANVNMNLAGSDAQAGEGTISATTQRVTIATDDDGVAHLATIAGAVSTQMQVDVVAISAQSDGTYIGDIKFGEALPAGSAAIGKLAANSGVDIGDVDVTSLPASTNTIEVVGDAAENANAAGNPVLVGGRYDSPGDDNASLRTLGDTDVGALALDPTGAAYVREALGQAGSCFVSGTNAVTAAYGKFVAIQFLEDSVFNSTDGLVATDTQRWPDDTSAATDVSSSNTAAVGSQVFPQGMTIFGRWNSFKLASGAVIAYIGNV